MKNKLVLALSIIATSSMLLTGCGSSYDSAYTLNDTTAYSTESYDSWGYDDYYAEDYYSDDYSTGSTNDKNVSVDDSAASVNSNRKLIKNVDMNVETKEFDNLLVVLERDVASFGGYVESSYTYNGSSYSYNYGYRPSRSADYTIRIPQNKLDAFINSMSSISNVISMNQNVEDVTLTYVDLESHKEALKAEEKRLLELLDIAETIDDIITIEDRVSYVRYQIDSMESQLRTYDNKINYSTVKMSIDEVEELTELAPDTVWERISSGFSENLEEVGENVVDFGVWFVTSIPFFVLWGVVIVIAALIFKLIRKIRRKKGGKTKNNKKLFRKKNDKNDKNNENNVNNTTNEEGESNGN